MRKNRMLVLVVVVLGALFSVVPRHARARIVPRTLTPAWHFVEIETTVHRAGVETSSDNPEERRWYLSNVVTQPEDVPTYSLIKQKIIPYFSQNVMDPAEKRGIIIDYGEQDVRLNGESSYANFATREEAEQERNKAIEYRKGQSGNIYSFEMVYGPAKGEETSKPKLIYRDRDQPNYEAKKP
jgi:hypothetical protein